MLQNAVHPLAELRQLKLTANQNRVAGVMLTYENYFKLLYSATINYDESFTHKKSVQWSALVHDVMPAIEDIDLDYDIDTGVDTVLANAAAHSTSSTYIPTSEWYELSGEARDLWQSLLEANHAIILGSSLKAGTSPLP